MSEIQSNSFQIGYLGFIAAEFKILVLQCVVSHNLLGVD